MQTREKCKKKCKEMYEKTTHPGGRAAELY